MSDSSVSLQHIGVLYAPFQIPYLGDYQTILEGMVKSHRIAIVILPVPHFPPTKNRPLSYEIRARMIQAKFPGVVVLPLKIPKYPENFASALESTVRLISNNSALVYMDDIDIYKTSGGKWPVRYISSSGEKDLRLRVCQVVATSLSSLSSGDDPLFLYRVGAIQTLQGQYPLNVPTVDIAIRRKDSVLLGKKPGEKVWRFPGGFKDWRDKILEEAALREAGEEVLKPEFLKDSRYALRFSTPKYIMSTNVDDWRYFGDDGGIVTTLFDVEFIGKNEDLKASDDLADVAWHQIAGIHVPSDIETEHEPLMTAYLEWCRQEGIIK